VTQSIAGAAPPPPDPCSCLLRASETEDLTQRRATHRLWSVRGGCVVPGPWCRTVRMACLASPRVRARQQCARRGGDTRRSRIRLSLHVSRRVSRGRRAPDRGRTALHVSDLVQRRRRRPILGTSHSQLCSVSRLDPSVTASVRLASRCQIPVCPPGVSAP
jgi:hypothetical protein